MTGIEPQGNHNFRIFKNDADLEMVAELDARAFGQHVSIDVPYLKEVVKHGVVFGEIVDEILVSEAQVILNAMKSAVEPLLRDLPKSAAYLEGFAVDPRLHSRGYGTALLIGAKSVAMAAGKDELLATARLENTNSLRVLTKRGYRGIGFDPSYYADEAGFGARVILRQVFSQSHDRGAIERQITVQSGDQPDIEAQQEFRDAVANGYTLASLEESTHTSDKFLLGLSRT